MDVGALLGLSVLLSFCAFGIVTILYILPRLRGMDRQDAIAALVVPHSFDAGGIWRSRRRHPCDDSGTGVVDPRVLGDIDRVGVQRVGRRRPLVRVLPGPDRYRHWPWLAGRRILHPDSCCASATRYPRADILAAVAAIALASRANHAGPAA